MKTAFRLLGLIGTAIMLNQVPRSLADEGSCYNLQVFYRTNNTGRAKCGFDEFGDPPASPKKYLNHTSTFYSTNSWVDPGWSPFSGSWTWYDAWRYSYYPTNSGCGYTSTNFDGFYTGIPDEYYPYFSCAWNSMAQVIGAEGQSYAPCCSDEPGYDLQANTRGATNIFVQEYMTIDQSGVWVEETHIYTYQRSDEYTTAMLIQYANADLTNAVFDGVNWSSGEASAYYQLTTNEVSVTAQRMMFQVQFRSEPDVHYELTWRERKVTTDGAGQSLTNYVNRTNNLPGQPFLTIYAETNAVPAYETGKIFVSRTPELCSFKVRPVQTCVSGGCGSSGDGGDGSTTSTFGDSSTGFSDGTGDQGIASSWGLGSGASGTAAGAIRLFAQRPSLSLATPSGLLISVLPAYADVRTNGSGVLQQIKTAQGLTHVEVMDNFKYRLHFFDLAHITTNAGSLYGTNGPAVVTWTIENPDASTSITNRLRLTETRDGSSIVSDYAYTNASGADVWTLTSGDGLRRVTNHVSRSGSVCTVTRSICEPSDGRLVAQTVSKYQTFSFGEVLIEETTGTGASATSVTNSYTAEGRLQKVTRSDGSWEYHDYDGSGRRARSYSAFGNNGFTTNYASCRVTEFDYGTNNVSGSGDDGTIEPNSPRKVTERVLDTVISVQFRVHLTNERRDVRAAPSASGWNDTNNLVTVTKLYPDGANAGRIWTIRHPDDTLTVYDYLVSADGLYRTNIVLHGEATASGTNIVAGSRTDTVQGMGGQTLFRQMSDVANSTNLTIQAREVHLVDALGRSTNVVFLNGTTNLLTYSCCGLESATDADGVMTSYDYDHLHRRTVTDRLGISTSLTYDAAGNVLKTVRVGTNSTAVTLSSAGYDLAGRMTASTNALGGVTSITEDYSSGARKVTTTNADGGTRIEEYYKDGQLAKVTGTAVNPVRYEYGVESESGTQRAFTKEIKLDGSYADTSEWTKSYTDFLGRIYKTVYPDSAYRQSWYNSKGQLWKERDPDGVITLYAYNAKGELAYTAVDMANWDQIDLGGSDRITQTTNDVWFNSTLNMHVQRSRTYVWGTNNNSTATLVSTREASTNGLVSWQVAFGLTNKSVTAYAANGYRYVTNTAPDGTFTVSQYQNGRLMAVTRKDSSGNQLGQTTYGYDPHGRQSTVTDARNGITTYTFNDADQVLTVTTPAPGTGQPAQVTATAYDTSLRAWKITQPDGTSVTNLFAATGALTTTSGSRVYPVRYTFDPQGRMKTMTTWQQAGNPDTAAVTTWNYNNRGFLSSKRYHDNRGTDYTYTPAGRLATRVWARSITATYTNDASGQLVGIGYSDGTTPSVVFAYDRLGRRATATQAGQTTSFGFTDAGLPSSESYSGGVLAGWGLTNSFDATLRRAGLSLNSLNYTFGYDAGSRLQSLTNGTAVMSYGFHANSDLPATATSKQSGTTRLTVNSSFDYLNRLQRISAAVNGSGAGFKSFSPLFNDANQKTRMILADGSFWIYSYDSLGQVISGKRYWADGSPVPGQQYEYGFDDIGNRTSTKAGGDQTGGNLRSASYSPTLLNQYQSRTVPGTFDVLGAADARASVSVNGSPADYRKIEYFWEPVSAVNSTGAVWQAVSVIATQGSTNATNSGSIFLPQTPEAFTNDYDGNLIQDGRWDYTWDGENRLVRIQARSTIPAGARKKVECEYDFMSRRIRKLSYTWNGSAWSLSDDQRFVYDGWNLVAVLNSDLTLRASFVWGRDLSGSEQGAGGVGGLLAMTVHSGAQAGTYFYAYDHNGNVVAMVNAADGSVAAEYEYGPFGELLRATGPMAYSNPFRFSTKYHDDETDLLYYGYRYYDPELGRWINRDHIGERGGVNLYVFALNKPLDIWDLLGLTTPVDVLNHFFGDYGEGLWIMGEDDEYTKRMREWSAVQQAIAQAKKDIVANCPTWESRRKTSPYWHPFITTQFSPDRASYRVPVRTPSDTDPAHAAISYSLYGVTGHISENLWYSAVGSFTVCVTVDSIDCCEGTAKLNVWVYNAMSQRSFSGFSRLYPFGKQANQYMWWHWTEDYSFWTNSGAGGTTGTTSTGGGGWGGTWW